MFPNRSTNPHEPPHDAANGPVRTRQREILTFDPISGTHISVPESRVETRFTPDGGIHTVERLMDYYTCRCDPRRPPGGSCSVCGGKSCQACSLTCAKCLAPICRAHTRIFEDSPSRSLHLCPSCHGAEARRRIGWTVVRGLLSPFVHFEEKPR